MRSKCAFRHIYLSYLFLFVDDVGLIEDKSNIDVKKIKKQLVSMDENLVNYKKLFDNLTVANMRQELADEALEKKWF